MKNDNGDFVGKSVVITGATSGIGLAAAIQFVRQGAFVIGIGRSEARIDTALKSVLSSNPKGDAVYVLADLAQQSEVRKLGEEIPKILVRHQYAHLDVLINNAGVYLEKKHKTIDGIEMTFAVNHLASFILTHELLPWIMQSKRGRILTVSSYSHRTTPLVLQRIANPRPYIGLLAYKRSKLCNVLFTYALNRRYEHVTAFVVDPGLVNTGIASKADPGISEWVWRRRRQKGTSAEVPVETLLYLAGEDQIETSDGFYFKDSQPLRPSRTARRKDLAENLWQLSCQLTGIQW